MASIREELRVGSTQLRQAGVESAHLDAQLLLAHALGTSRTQLLARLSENAAEPTSEVYRDLLARRTLREPLAYITGMQEFWGRSYNVTPATLIPRPETETLVERAIELGRREARRIVDVGTGSGCIAVSVALDLPSAVVYATDISRDALEVARRNAWRHGVARRVVLLEGSLLQPVPAGVDLVLANLPYVPGGELGDLQPEVGGWEPRSALDGGEDGLDLVRCLLAQLPEKLQADGVCLLEIDPRQFPRLRVDAARILPGWRVQDLKDLFGRSRIAELRPFTGS